MFGLEAFKAFASTPIGNVIIAMIPQMNIKAFVKFQIVEPKNRLIVFSIFSNDSNIEIVSKKKQIWESAFEFDPSRSWEACDRFSRMPGYGKI